MSNSIGISYTPKKSEDYYPHTVKRLLFKIKQLNIQILNNKVLENDIYIIADVIEIPEQILYNQN